MAKNYTIGVLGGMGTYATIHQFQQYAEVFPAEKEWDRPRIIIDNRCTMPSRVRAFLYNENRDKLVDEMTESMQNLIRSGCTRIILACNTSHIFLPQIYEKVPELEKRVVNIVHECVDKVKADGLSQVYLLASEGTITARIFQDAFSRVGIDCLFPAEKDFVLLRDCIEAVKQNHYTEQTKWEFLELVNRFNAIVLGCTELPVLYELYKEEVTSERIYDPLYIGLQIMKKEYDCE